jgi:hypothetical protein
MLQIIDENMMAEIRKIIADNLYYDENSEELAEKIYAYIQKHQFDVLRVNQGQDTTSN